MKQLVDVNVPKPKEVTKVSSPEAEKKPDLADRIVEAQEKAIVNQATAQAFGLGQGGGEKEDPLATQIVTKSMEAQNQLIKDMKDDARELQKEVKSANQSATDMQYLLLQDTLKRIETAQLKSDESAKAAQAAGAPKDAFGYYKQVKGELETLVQSIKPAQDAAVQTGVMDNPTQIRLKELELQQQQVLAQITADNTRAQNQFQLQMLEFQDNKEVRRMEYQDKKHFREEGLAGVTDIVAAIGAGVRQEGGPSNPGTETADRPKRVGKSDEQELGAYVNSFKCSVCGEEVPVQDGQEVAKCSNPECNATFTIKAKE